MRLNDGIKKFLWDILTWYPDGTFCPVRAKVANWGIPGAPRWVVVLCYHAKRDIPLDEEYYRRDSEALANAVNRYIIRATNKEVAR